MDTQGRDGPQRADPEAATARGVERAAPRMVAKAVSEPPVVARVGLCQAARVATSGPSTLAGSSACGTALSKTRWWNRRSLQGLAS
jgi:hypothetical protein